MKIITSVLEGVMLRPSMYIGQLHLDRFECFICGYTCGCEVHYRQEWYEFGEWIMKKHSHGHSSIGPCGVIANKFGWKKRGMKELIRLWNEYKCKK
jgi:hypothetical protein